VHHPPYSFLARLLGKVLRLKEAKPQLPVGLDPQVPLTDSHKNGGLRDEVGGKMIEFYPVIMRDSPYKMAQWCAEPPLVESNEADHIVLWWRQLLVVGRWHPLLR
jgi:hypothetical protein